MIHRLISISLCCLACACWGPAAAQAPPDTCALYFPEKTYVAPGETFWTDLCIRKVNLVEGIYMRIGWDTAVLSLNQMNAGPLLPDLTPNPDNGVLVWLSPNPVPLPDGTIVVRCQFTAAAQPPNDTTVIGFDSVPSPEVLGMPFHLLPGLVIIRDCPLHWLPPSPDTSLCPGRSALIGPSAALPGCQYKWSNGDTSARIAVSQPDTYVLSVTNAEGCTAADTVLVLARPLLALTPLADTARCGTGTVQVCLQNTELGWTYDWLPNHETASCIMADTAGSYAVTVTDAQGCTAASAMTLSDAALTLAPLPDTTLCSCSPLQIGPDNAPPDWVFLWSNGDTTARVSVSQTGAYALTVTNAEGCTAADTVLVAAGKLALPNLPAQTVCPGDSAILGFASAGPCLKYNWSSGDTAFSITVQQPGTYTVTVSDAAGCSATAEQVAGHFALQGRAEPESQQIVRLDSALLTASGGVSYLWSTGDTTASITIGPVADAWFFVTITEAGGCLSFDSARVLVVAGRLANVFTPNGDGWNDVLVFDEIVTLSGSLLPARLVVWDNWGNTVYDDTRYQNNWGGTLGNLHGLPLPQDTYFFTLQYGQPAQVRRGTMTIIR